jgi:tryptophanyl-tRNA synthetase
VKFLKDLLDRNRQWAEILRETVRKSVEEYMVLGLDPWKGRRSAQEVLKRIL